MTWYVVSFWDLQNENEKKKWPDSEPRPEDAIWTLSREPKKLGWINDGDCGGYGLTKKDAEELANAANASPPMGTKKYFIDKVNLTTNMLVEMLNTEWQQKPDKVLLQSRPDQDLSDLDIEEVRKRTGVEIEVLF